MNLCSLRKNQGSTASKAQKAKKLNRLIPLQLKNNRKSSKFKMIKLLTQTNHSLRC